MKTFRTIKLVASAARKELDEAKEILSPLRRPSGKGLSGADAQRAWFLIDKADAHLQGLVGYISMMPTELGRKGGRKTAERGSEYFRQLAAMRKTKAGGRPKAEKPASDSEQQ